ncbi:uncharacterized [Tachysurus ichikawai]
MTDTPSFPPSLIYPAPLSRCLATTSMAQQPLMEFCNPIIPHYRLHTFLLPSIDREMLVKSGFDQSPEKCQSVSEIKPCAGSICSAFTRSASLRSGVLGQIFTNRPSEITCTAVFDEKENGVKSSVEDIAVLFILSSKEQ